MIEVRADGGDRALDREAGGTELYRPRRTRRRARHSRSDGPPWKPPAAEPRCGPVAVETGAVARPTANATPPTATTRAMPRSTFRSTPPPPSAADDRRLDRHGRDWSVERAVERIGPGSRSGFGAAHADGGAAAAVE